MFPPPSFSCSQVSPPIAFLLFHASITQSKEWSFSSSSAIPLRFTTKWGSLLTQLVKNLPAKTGDTTDKRSIPGSGRSPGERNGNPLQYSCLENSMDRGAWLAVVHGIAKSWTWLSTHACTHNQRQYQNTFYHKTYKYFSNKYVILYMHNIKSQPWKVLLWKNKPKSIIGSLKIVSVIMLVTCTFILSNRKSVIDTRVLSKIYEKMISN